MQEWQMEMASKQEEEERNFKLREVSMKAFPDKLLGCGQYKTFVCLECGEDLPEFRMQRGLTECVPCLEAKAKKDKIFGRN